MANNKDSSITEAAKAMGSRGGTARAEVLTEEERKSIAAKGAAARWAGHTKKAGKTAENSKALQELSKSVQFVDSAKKAGKKKAGAK